MGMVARLPRAWQAPVGRRISKVLTFFRIISWAMGRRSVARDIEPGVLIPTFEEARANDPELVRYGIVLATKTEQTFLESTDRLNAVQLKEALRWPGHHYRLLKAIVADQQPKLIVEIGTYAGLSALAMLEALPKGSRIVTYDLLAWDRFPDTVLRKEDFANGVEQRLGDLSSPAYFASQRDVMLEADIFFMDGPKDGRFEPAFFSLLRDERVKDGLMIWDDIRLLQMVEMWRTLEYPKMDLTSYGHWTGTGIVRIGRQ